MSEGKEQKEEKATAPKKEQPVESSQRRGGAGPHFQKRAWAGPAGGERPGRRVGGRRERRGAPAGGRFAEQRVQYKKQCLFCRKVGHTLAECRAAQGRAGVCYNCGSTEHSLRDCPEPPAAGGLRFAKCFVCGETGHLASACPKNSKGMYPHGGCCRLCGSVYHLKANCPLANRRTAELNGLAVLEPLPGDPAAGPVSGDADIDDAAAAAAAAEPPTKRAKNTQKSKTVSF